MEQLPFFFRGISLTDLGQIPGRLVQGIQEPLGEPPYGELADEDQEQEGNDPPGQQGFQGTEQFRLGPGHPEHAAVGESLGRIQGHFLEGGGMTGIAALAFSQGFGDFRPFPVVGHPGCFFIRIIEYGAMVIHPGETQVGRRLAGTPEENVGIAVMFHLGAHDLGHLLEVRQGLAFGGLPGGKGAD